MNKKRYTVLGLDIGSVSTGIVEMTPDFKILNCAYGFHQGNIAATLEDLLSEFDLEKVAWVAANDGAPDAIKTTCRFDDQTLSITAALHTHPDAGAILNVGGEKFHLIRLGKGNAYLGSRGSTSCAAGTGAFLDQQARRLGLKSAAQLGRLADKNKDARPKIASRCSVFAKTDLTHAQQEGFSISAICDGLCQGLARNIADTVFKDGSISRPIVFTGGVALNSAVCRHIRQHAASSLVVPERPELVGAMGAAIRFVEEHINGNGTTFEKVCLENAGGLLQTGRKKETCTYPPLSPELSHYPDFSSLEQYRDPHGHDQSPEMDVEVDIYENMTGRQNIFIGIDIGSTSTKAALVTAEKTVLAGFYTRTAGQPLAAVQRLFKSITAAGRRHGWQPVVMGAGTTGSGRKFIGQIIGSDLVLDEISAHARAAIELNPLVDTIIEIGGQDAKFTTLKNGRVTSATMNTVCAAGTGSFIEEQAAKLGCPLDDYSDRAQNRVAPLSSDRCTVFMERDLNFYLTEGWDVDAVLASVLHSVRENYLIKVATQSRMGDVILFQGATAKNRALVAAFEQRLEKPILVSDYCHLTGALGTALTLIDEGIKSGTDARISYFRGLDLWQANIPIRTEVCELCTNHCKLSVADVAGRTVACGFLCGRDYDTGHFVPTKSRAFDLIGQRRKAFCHNRRISTQKQTVIGLPAGGHLVEDLPRWQYLFDCLGFKTITSEKVDTAVRIGRPLTGAEFCAPITALHGHVAYLKDRCDYIFLPVYLEDRQNSNKIRRQYCYYTQYASALTAPLASDGAAGVLSPLIRYLYTGFHTRVELYRMLKTIPGANIPFRDLSAAYDAALAFRKKGRQKLISAWKQHVAKGGSDIKVALLGRPYTLFSPSLNCGIPELLQKQGIDCMYQEMMDITSEHTDRIRPLLDEIHWRYAARILAAAQAAAMTPGIYPVLITSFKCSPDAFVRDYVKKIMEAHDKPFLVLELDEHDSSVGYETRIEAAVRAFRNHHQKSDLKKTHPVARVNPDLSRGKTRRTIVLPNWDRLSGRLLEAVLRREGRKVVLMQESPMTIAKSMRENTGQCIPINAIVQGFVECLEQNSLLPEEAVLWMSRSTIACNIPLYPHHMKTLLNDRGNGFENAKVHVGDLFFKDISPRAAFNAVFAYMFGGLLRRTACRLRPYEVNPGETDNVLDMALEILFEAFLGRMSKQDALKAVVERFLKIDVHPRTYPKVAIFGDLYSRDNRVMNQDLIRFIEHHGGEVVTTPYTEYARMIASPYFRKWFFERKYLTLLTNRTLMAAITRLERRYYRYFEPILGQPMAAFDDPPQEILAPYGVRLENTGESLDNVIKVHYIKKHYPDVALFVQASPAFCCPSLVTEAMSSQIEKITGIPVVPITYDGTGGSKNDILIPYLKFPGAADRQSLGRLDRIA